MTGTVKQFLGSVVGHDYSGKRPASAAVELEFFQRPLVLPLGLDGPEFVATRPDEFLHCGH
jgi:hypothetical protein